jgi:hypothetical protein
MQKEMTQEQRKAVIEEIVAELHARPQGKPMSSSEFLSFVDRMPGMPEGWTSADIIRELRGPLPEDDPEWLRTHGRR